MAQAFILGKEFIGNDSVCLVLGDNIFYGHGFSGLIHNAVNVVEQTANAAAFGYWVSNPDRYGVCTFDENGNVTTIEEKPEKPKSNYAVVGLYFYPNSVVKVAQQIKPSPRGELDITTVNQEYLDNGELKVELMGRGYAWLDTGTNESLLEASQFVETLEKRTGLKIACLEEIAMSYKWVDKDIVYKEVKGLKGDYYDYLKKIIKK